MSETAVPGKTWTTELGSAYADGGYGVRLPDQQYFYPPDGGPGITASGMCEVADALNTSVRVYREQLVQAVEALRWIADANSPEPIATAEAALIRLRWRD